MESDPAGQTVFLWPQPSGGCWLINWPILRVEHHLHSWTQQYGLPTKTKHDFKTEILSGRSQTLYSLRSISLWRVPRKSHFETRFLNTLTPRLTSCLSKTSLVFSLYQISRMVKVGEKLYSPWIYIYWRLNLWPTLFFFHFNTFLLISSWYSMLH